MRVLFVETSVFTDLRGDYLDDDEYRHFQWYLAETPDAGAVIRGTGGDPEGSLVCGRARQARGRSRDLPVAQGKDRIYLLTVYGKNTKDDLTAAERKAWRTVVEEIERNG